MGQRSAPLLAQPGACTDALLARCAGAGPVDTVLRTGGSSRLPALRRRLTDRSGEARVRTAVVLTRVAEGPGRAALARA